MDRREAAKKVFEAQRRFEALGMVNTYGKTPEERLELAADYQLARLDLIHAENELSRIDRYNA